MFWNTSYSVHLYHVFGVIKCVVFMSLLVSCVCGYVYMVCGFVSVMHLSPWPVPVSKLCTPNTLYIRNSVSGVYLALSVCFYQCGMYPSITVGYYSIIMWFLMYVGMRAYMRAQEVAVLLFVHEQTCLCANMDAKTQYFVCFNIY